MQGVYATFRDNMADYEAPDVSGTILMVQHRASEKVEQLNIATNHTQLHLTEYEVKRAQDMVHWAIHAYQNDSELSTSSWIFQDAIDVSNAHAKVYFNDQGQCLVAFRGTDGLDDWIRANLLSISTAPVKNKISNRTVDVPIGFVVYYDLVREQILNVCGERPMIASGHSLGGAAAEVAVFRGDAIESWNFGGPKTVVAQGSKSCPSMPNSYSFYTEFDATEEFAEFDATDAVPTLPNMMYFENMLVPEDHEAIYPFHCAHKHVKLSGKSSLVANAFKQIVGSSDWAALLNNVENSYEVQSDRTEPGFPQIGKLFIEKQPLSVIDIVNVALECRLSMPLHNKYVYENFLSSLSFQSKAQANFNVELW